jgi:SAM-dependent methyltransferase
MTASPEFSRNIERFTGFADLYDRFRPGPPADLASLLARYSGRSAIDRVVDLGSGTGLSTRYWAAHAREVVGIEPTADMRRRAAALSTAGTIAYRDGLSHETGLPDGFAQIVSCSQALHWMKPLETFREARRILLPGGVFAAIDYDWPPTVGSWEAEAAYAACMESVGRLGKERRISEGLQQWEKSGHLERMRSSGCFRFVKEFALHHVDMGNAERFVGVLLSQGGVMGLLKAGVGEDALLIDSLRAVAERTLGSSPRPWTWSARVRVGVVA